MAGPEFVRRLIEHNISAKNVREHVGAFVQSALKDVKDRHGQAARVAQRFGLVYAAGELGVQFGILPWEQSDSLNDATELLKVWLDERGGGSGPYEARQAVAQVRHFIEAHGDSRFDDITTPDPDRKPVANRRASAEIKAKPDAGSFRRRSGAMRAAPVSMLERSLRPLRACRCLNLTGKANFRGRNHRGKEATRLRAEAGRFEGWEEAAETHSEHLEHQAHIKMKVSQN